MRNFPVNPGSAKRSDGKNTKKRGKCPFRAKPRISCRGLGRRVLHAVFLEENRTRYSF